jgi:hypothetical protein
MRRAIDRLAASTSTRIIAWTRSRVDDSRREWLDAMAAELAAIEGGWRKLAWAIEGLPLAWSFSRWRENRRESQMRRMPMNAQLAATRRSSFDSFVLNAVTLVAWWVMLTLWIRTWFPNGLGSEPGDWRVGEITILAACALGTVAALAIRRTGAAYVLAGFVAFGAVEFAFHLQFGIRAVQGGPAHFADMTAGILGVTFAALTESRVGGFGGERAWDARKVGTSLLRAGLTIRRNLGSWAHLALGIIAFATAEAAIRLYFASWLQMNGLGWRWRHLFLDGKTNYAILGCAVLGAVLGALIGKWGDRLAIPMPSRKHAAESSSA